MIRLLATLALLCACDQPPPECPPPEPQGCADRFYHIGKSLHVAGCDPGQSLTVTGNIAICRCPGGADGGAQP